MDAEHPDGLTFESPLRITIAKTPGGYEHRCLSTFVAEVLERQELLR